ncbi:hypothetical protein CARUB_v10009440mg [Capsella rubella]|uniref:F-box domain-containing protein n=1 Tax=Capsella rubella TaxID=81985 RepID=R0IHT0_9BRAS|nr:F-box protein At1g30790 [Capsella rubella]EOA37970.1 hypothetical protein CARUB_v10009440mg [Capsella rubella]
MTTAGYNFPLDLTIEILLRLPAKSLFRFRSVSKTWCSIIRSRQFASEFMSLSLSRPRLLFTFNNCCDTRLLFFSSPHQSCYLSSSPSSMLASKKNFLTMPIVMSSFDIVLSNSVRGFICSSLRGKFVVCNPNTRQVIHLGENSFESDYDCYMYLGYDPSNDQYKVLRLTMNTRSHSPVEHSVCTLGGGEPSLYSWRNIKSSVIYYDCMHNGVCIDGVVYYEASLKVEYGNASMRVSSFDVGSEQIRPMKTPEHFGGFLLTNYLGKLAAYHDVDDGYFALWVLDDVKNQVWTKKVCVFPSFTFTMLWDLDLRFAGITAAGEVVYAPLYFCDPFEVFCYDVEKKMERRVRVEGLVDDVYEGSTFKRRFHTSLLCCYVDNIMIL